MKKVSVKILLVILSFSLLGGVFLSGCGKKGPPLPPLPEEPAKEKRGDKEGASLMQLPGHEAVRFGQDENGREKMSAERGTRGLS